MSATATNLLFIFRVSLVFLIVIKKFYVFLRPSELANNGKSLFFCKLLLKLRIRISTLNMIKAEQGRAGLRGITFPS